MTPAAQSKLIASYRGSDDSKTFSITLSQADKTKYLGSLRESVVKMQADINAFMTQKMEDDVRKGKTNGADEKREEENYGEEIVN